MTSRPRSAQRPNAGHRGWRVLAGGVLFVGRVLRGLIAAAVLGALVAGLPWALWHYIGWPLPDHVPTWVEVEAVLRSPMTTTFMLDILACVCWITWAAFTIDVIRCTLNLARDCVDAARLLHFSGTGPTHALARILVGAVLLSVLGHRPTPASATSPTTVLGTGTGIVATAPAWHKTPPSGNETPVQRPATYTTPASGLIPDNTTPHPKSVIVREPENGVHDSLWRVAQRTLGDGARWPEIFKLNKGKPQPYGHTFTNPNLIFPGQELTLPTEVAASSPRPNDPIPPPAPPEPAHSPPPTSAQPSGPTTPAPSTQNTQETSPTSAKTNSQLPTPREPGVRWGPELFVGLGLTAAVSAALMVARRRHNSRYQPGSGDRTELPIAPVVYQLRLAHLRTEASDAGEDMEFDLEDPDDGDRSGSTRHGGRQHASALPPLVVGAHETGSREWPALAPVLGVRDGRETAMDLANARGLGLVGVGAIAAARALLIAALTASKAHPADRTSVLVPADDLAGLLGRTAASTPLPAALRVVQDLDDALDALEAETLVRAATSHEQNTPEYSRPALLLVARPPEHGWQRLQAVLDNGTPFGVTGLLLGQWRPGVTAYIRADGTVSATSPGLGEPLRGTQVFRLGEDNTGELLTLLHQAEPTTRDDVQRDMHVPLSPARRPRLVSPEPATGEHQTSDPVTNTALEILGPSRATASGTRLRRPAVPVQQTATLQRAEDAASLHNVPDDSTHKATRDQSAWTDEHNTTVVAFAPLEAEPGEGTPSADTVSAAIRIAVLGPLRVYWTPEPHNPTTCTSADVDERRQEITGVLQPRTRELLVLLALHPEGITREALVSALWGEDPPARPTNALHTSLSRLRQALATATDGAVTEIAVVGNGRYQLDPVKVAVDYWRFAKAVVARRTALTGQARIDAYREVVNSYSGALAEGMTTEWIEPAREAIRRDAIDAVAALARSLVEVDPQQTLDLLEIARTFDPHNELLYRDIMRLQERLGQLDAIPRTLSLLRTRLAEIDEAPSSQACELATRLGQRHDNPPGDATHAPPSPAAEPVSKGERGRSAAS